jgi:hypothetical protein
MRYSWEIPCVLAILQTDEASIHRAFYEAIEAMEQRHLTPINAAEDVAFGWRRSRSANANRGNDCEVRSDV